MNPLYLFAHLPKTAGETFKRNSEKSLPKGGVIRSSFTYSEPFYNLQSKKVDFFRGKAHFTDYIASLSNEQKLAVKCVGGHDTYFGLHLLFPMRDCRYITFVREPLARTLSLYNYERMAWGIYSEMKGPLTPLQSYFLKRLQDHFLVQGRIPRFEEWLEERYDRATLFYYSIKRYLEHLGFSTDLRQFYFIGITENHTEDTLFLYSLLGVRKFASDKNASPSFVRLSDLDVGTKQKLAKMNEADTELYQLALKHNAAFKKEHLHFVPIVNKMKKKKDSYMRKFAFLSFFKRIFGKKAVT
jgi:hypothetical protein